MRALVIATILAAAVVAVAGTVELCAKSLEVPEPAQKTTNTATLELVQVEHEKALQRLREAQAEVFRLEGAVRIMQIVVDQEQTSSPATMPPLPRQ